MADPKLTTQQQAKRGAVLLAIMAEQHPTQLTGLLEAHGLQFAESPSAKQLLDGLYALLETGEPDFLSDLTRLISLFTSEQTYQSFSGVDPVSAVSSAVSSLGEVFTAGNKSRDLKQQIRGQTLQSYLALQGLKQNLDAQQASRQFARERNRSYLVMLGLLLLAGLGVTMLIKNDVL